MTEEEKPPFLGSWRRVYVAVLIYLAGMIVFCGIFGRIFTP